jgi:hypothetical protein
MGQQSKKGYLEYTIYWLLNQDFLEKFCRTQWNK